MKPMHISEDRLLEILDRSADPVTEKEAEHLRHCSDCGGLYRQYLKLYPKLADLTVPELPPDFSLQVLAALPETPAERNANNSWQLWLGLGLLTAGLLSVLQLVYGLFSGMGSNMITFVSSAGDKAGLGRMLKGLIADDSFRLLLMVPLCFGAVSLLDRFIRRRHPMVRG